MDGRLLPAAPARGYAQARLAALLALATIYGGGHHRPAGRPTATPRSGAWRRAGRAGPDWLVAPRPRTGRHPAPRMAAPCWP
jgi:hypothetical protein